MARYNQEIINVYIPVSTDILVEMSPASPTRHKTPTKYKMSDNALTYIRSQIDVLTEEIEKKIPIAKNLKMI